MVREDLARIPRQTADKLLDAVYDAHMENRLAILESALNIEWWRGYYAAVDLAENLSAAVRDQPDAAL